MKVYFRVDASIHIGSGHVMRCLSLANQLQKSGYDIVFVIRPQNGDLSAYIAELGYKVIKLNRLNTFAIYILLSESLFMIHQISGYFL